MFATFVQRFNPDSLNLEFSGMLAACSESSNSKHIIQNKHLANTSMPPGYVNIVANITHFSINVRSSLTTLKENV